MRHQLDAQLYRDRIAWRSGGQLCGRQFGHGHPVHARTQSEFDFRPVVQDGVLCAGRIQFSQQRRAWRNANTGTHFAGQSISHGHVENTRPSSKPRDRKSACARRPPHICKARFHSGISTVNPNCCRMATPEARSPSLSPSNRYGIEWANYYTPLEHWAFDFDFADSRAFFTQIDPDDAAPGSPVGSAYPKRWDWWRQRAPRCTTTNAFRRVCACAPLARAI